MSPAIRARRCINHLSDDGVGGAFMHMRLPITCLKKTWATTTK
jgi:hypothetical protein